MIYKNIHLTTLKISAIVRIFKEKHKQLVCF